MWYNRIVVWPTAEAQKERRILAFGKKFDNVGCKQKYKIRRSKKKAEKVQNKYYKWVLLTRQRHTKLYSQPRIRGKK